jgi:hypothetical protein
MDITIVEDAGLPERAARINRRTYDAIKRAKGNPTFFPDVGALGVGQDPFDPDYILFIVDDTMIDNMLVVSSDVKGRYYANRNALSF